MQTNSSNETAISRWLRLGRSSRVVAGEPRGHGGPQGPRLKRMKQRMEKERTITKKVYDQALAKMTEMVKAGEITREQMEQRLERMGRIVAGEDQPDGTSDECRVLGIVLRKAVSTGEMTAEEAKAAWEAACGKK